MSVLHVDPRRSTFALPRLRGLSWVTWRQHRMALAGVVAVLGGLAVFMLFNGLSTRHAYDTLGLNHCGNLNGLACQAPLSLFSQNYALKLPRILEFLPGVIGVFVGAPLVARELESGTFRFAWTQGCTPLRWIAVELGLLAGALAALALAFSAMFGWWFAPWDPIMGRVVAGQAYEVEGLVFAARTLFAFTLGAFLGAVIRRTVPAMAATAAGWLAVVWPSVIYLRPLIEKPVTVPAGSNLIANGWSLENWVQDRGGHHLTAAELLHLNAHVRSAGVTSDGAYRSWLHTHGYSEWVSYQPNARFWHFQSIETAAYLVVALALAGATLWWVRRRAA